MKGSHGFVPLVVLMFGIDDFRGQVLMASMGFR